MSPSQSPGSAYSTRFLTRIALSALFLVAAGWYASTLAAGSPTLLIIAAVFAAYMAMNIGANDVANNVGPAIGARALTMTAAIVLAGIMEAAGSLLAGGDVVGTVKGDIINPANISDPQVFIWLMMAALLAGALWLNLATAVGAPVSTTHSIVGGVLGAGVAAGGWDIANWSKLQEIAMSWVISPVMGGIIAAAFLFFIKHSITYQSDMRAAAQRVVPLLTALMAWAFSAYIITKGLRQLVKVDMLPAMGIGVVVGFVAWLAMNRFVRGAAANLSNDKEGVNKLFVIPLICSAALLSFAHGANDVANAIGPLAAIYDALSQATVAAKAAIPLWVMMIGALGLVVGLALYGPKLIQTVGSEITELDQMRAFCIAMSAAVTVLIASHLGLPVSSTHIAVGGVFGVGFLREMIKASYNRKILEIEAHHQGEDRAVVEAFLQKFEAAPVIEQGRMLEELKQRNKSNSPALLNKDERKQLKKIHRQQLVKRSILVKIAAAWLITVPASALLAATIFFTIRGMMLP
jgi:inorganic phosphate transporter, PiT family